jgi:hypothetical protein
MLALTMSSGSASPPQGQSSVVFKLEDWLLVGWVALASPLLYRVQGSAGLFDSGHPLAGFIDLVAVLGALACLAVRRPAADVARETSFVDRGAVGPFVGGLLLVLISAFTALNAAQPVVLAVLAGAIVLLVLVRVLVPPLPAVARRALVSPFVMVTAGIFWSLTEGIVGGSTGGGAFGLDTVQLLRTPPALLFLAAFSAVYYAMLVYAPRQIADREGGIIAWGLRYTAFALSVILGLGWLRIVGT